MVQGLRPQLLPWERVCTDPSPFPTCRKPAHPLLLVDPLPPAEPAPPSDLPETLATQCPASVGSRGEGHACPTPRHLMRSTENRGSTAPCPALLPWWSMESGTRRSEEPLTAPLCSGDGGSPGSPSLLSVSKLVPDQRHYSSLPSLCSHQCKSYTSFGEILSQMFWKSTPGTLTLSQGPLVISTMEPPSGRFTCACPSDTCGFPASD